MKRETLGLTVGGFCHLADDHPHLHSNMWSFRSGVGVRSLCASNFVFKKFGKGKFFTQFFKAPPSWRGLEINAVAVR